MRSGRRILLWKTLIVEMDVDGRVSMVSRARTFEQIVSGIGTARSRRVDQAMQRAEEETTDSR